MGLGASVQYTRSTATYDKASDVIRLVVTPGVSLLRAAPGQYYYLYQPFRLKGWESHPFTLGAWTFDGAERNSHTSLVKPFTEMVDPSRAPLMSSSGPASGNLEPPPSRCESETFTTTTKLRQSLVFWIRPYGGWTRFLRDQCLRSPTLTIDSTILLEGPYGDAFPIWEYDSVLLVAGGTGIAAAVPYIQTHQDRSESEQMSGKARTRPHNLHLVWSCRQRSLIQNIASNELRQAFESEDFRASLYRTGTNRSTPDDAAAASDTLDIENGRPDLRLVVINEAALMAAEGSNSLAVIVCGPSGMASETREAVCGAIKQGYRGIRYVEESFSW